MSNFTSRSICVVGFALSLVIALWASTYIGMGLFYGILWSPIALIAVLLLIFLSIHLLQYIKEKYPTKRRIQRDYIEALNRLIWRNTKELYDIYTQFIAMDKWQVDSSFLRLDEFYPRVLNDDEEPDRLALLGAVFLGLDYKRAGISKDEVKRAFKRVQIVLSYSLSSSIVLSQPTSSPTDGFNIAEFSSNKFVLAGIVFLTGFIDLKRYSVVKENNPTTRGEHIANFINNNLHYLDYWMIYYPLRFIMSIAFTWLVISCVATVFMIVIIRQEHYRRCYNFLHANPPFNKPGSMFLVLIIIYVLFFIISVQFAFSIIDTYIYLSIYEYIYIPLYNMLSFYMTDMTAKSSYSLLLFASFLSMLLAVVLRRKYVTVALCLLFFGVVLITLGTLADTMSDKIRFAQYKLHSLGIHSSPLDGTMESNTRAALKKYQESRDLPVTGHLDKATQEVLSKDTSIQPQAVPSAEERVKAAFEAKKRATEGKKDSSGKDVTIKHEPGIIPGTLR